MRHLVPCAGCARHVRAAEARCPFCDAALPESLRAAAPRAAGSSRLSRAATYALGTALGASLAAASACGDGGGQVAAYGGPPPQEGTTGGEVTPTTGDAGAPTPMPDADAGLVEVDPVYGGSVVALYGAPYAPPQPSPPAPAYGGPPPRP